MVDEDMELTCLSRYHEPAGQPSVQRIKIRSEDSS